MCQGRAYNNFDTTLKVRRHDSYVSCRVPVTGMPVSDKYRGSLRDHGTSRSYDAERFAELMRKILPVLQTTI